MPRRITREDYVRRLQKNEKRVKYLKQRIKIMERKRSEELRKERTHRLCNHGADLEVYLKPDLFTDEEIRNILKEIFALPEVKKIVEKKPPAQPDSQVHFEEMRNYTPDRV